MRRRWDGGCILRPRHGAAGLRQPPLRRRPLHDLRAAKHDHRGGDTVGLEGQFGLAQFEQHPHATHLGLVEQMPVILGQAVAGRGEDFLHVFRDQGHVVAERGVGQDAAGLGPRGGVSGRNGCSRDRPFGGNPCR